MNPVPSLGNAYHLVAEDERQKAISADKKPTTEAAAFKACYPKWWSGKKKREETKPKVAFIEPGRNSPIPGLANDQYGSFLKHFSEMGSSGKKDNASKAYMTAIIIPNEETILVEGKENVFCQEELQ
nr:hypothetical protein [Tanacetum cinerariifolium]